MYLCGTCSEQRILFTFRLNRIKESLTDCQSVWLPLPWFCGAHIFRYETKQKKMYRFAWRGGEIAYETKVSRNSHLMFIRLWCVWRGGDDGLNNNNNNSRKHIHSNCTSFLHFKYSVILWPTVWSAFERKMKFKTRWNGSDIKNNILFPPNPMALWP